MTIALGIVVALSAPAAGWAQTPSPSPSPTSPTTTLKDCSDCPELAIIAPGSFAMGGRELEPEGRSEPDELPIHQVKIGTGFALGVTDVTQAEWTAIMGSNPSQYEDAGKPVETVSWDDAQEFLRRLSQKTGKQYRLPTEAEWEYAARAGSTTLWWFGDDKSSLRDYAWYQLNAGGQTHVVKKRLPNPWGLYDMYGNVWQWVSDCYHPNYKGAPTDGQAWLTASCGKRVIRGGSWRSDDDDASSIERGSALPSKRSGILGFRVARSLTP
jgi:formylglycine-generating enzyme required for sulfatase activity